MALLRLLMSLQKPLLTFDPVDAVLAVRVLVVTMKLLHWGVSDELGSNLLELRTTLLVDTSGASSSVMIKSVTRALMMIFSAVSGSTVDLSISINAQMLIMTESSPLAGAGNCMALGECEFLVVRLAVGRTPANSSRVSCDGCRSYIRVTVLPRFKAID